MISTDRSKTTLIIFFEETYFLPSPPTVVLFVYCTSRAERLKTIENSTFCGPVCYYLIKSFLSNYSFSACPPPPHIAPTAKAMVLPRPSYPEYRGTYLREWRIIKYGSIPCCRSGGDSLSPEGRSPHSPRTLATTMLAIFCITERSVIDEDIDIIYSYALRRRGDYEDMEHE